MNEDIQKRLQLLLEQLNERVYGKQQFIALALLSALAGESMFLLGPPGVAKSMIGNRLKLAFKDATAFEYLMSRFSTPDELFGPVAISKLKNEDVYERLVAGYLPAADVAFLDEIWKAGPAIQNALLTILNERTFRNGTKVIKVPLKGFIAASNELPAVGQGLEALWDRFVIRCLVGNVEDMDDFDRMLLDTEDYEPAVKLEWQIDSKEYQAWQNQMSQIKVPYSVLEVIHSLKDLIESYNQKLQNAGESSPLLYVSDRRWKKCIRILKASAFLNGADTVRLSDCLLLRHCLWSELSQQDEVNRMVDEALCHSLESYLLNVDTLKQDLEELRKKMGSEHGLREEDDPGLVVVDGFYYQIQGARMRERLLMFVADYKQLTSEGQLFYLQKDKYKANCCILKKYDAVLHAKVSPAKCFTLTKGLRSVVINGYEYKLQCHPDCAPLRQVPQVQAGDVARELSQLHTRFTALSGSYQELVRKELDYVTSHLFLSNEEKRRVEEVLQTQTLGISRFKNELKELENAFAQENKEYPIEGIETDLLQ